MTKIDTEKISRVKKSKTNWWNKPEEVGGKGDASQESQQGRGVEHQGTAAVTIAAVSSMETDLTTSSHMVVVWVFERGGTFELFEPVE